MLTLSARSLRRARAAVAAVAVIAVAAPASPTFAQQVPSSEYEPVLDVAFPTRADARFHDGYDDCRDGCARTHKATDLMGAKMWPLYAMVDGTVCRVNDDEAEDSYGRNITICGADGRRYRYLHLNNDTPGTDDGNASLADVYGPGIRRGRTVVRGQHIAYMGDSGNAEGTGAHLHLDIFDDAVVDPYGDNRINPYPSLVAAKARGDFPDGTAFVADPVGRVDGGDRVDTAVALSRSTFSTADTVVLAPADVPADALAAGPLAALLDAPVLTTDARRLDPRVADEIARLGAGTVVVVGGRLDPVVGQLPDSVTVDRLAGGDRYATAVAVAERVWEMTGASGEPVERGTVDGSPLDGHVTEGSRSGGNDGDGAGATLEALAIEGPLAVWASASADRSGPVLLDGAHVAGPVAVTVAGVGSQQDNHVRFDVDGVPSTVERRFPYDLAGGGLVDLHRLPDGSHTLTVTVTDAHTGQTIGTATATFEVADSGPTVDGDDAMPDTDGNDGHGGDEMTLALAGRTAGVDDAAVALHAADGASAADDVTVVVAAPTADGLPAGPVTFTVAVADDADGLAAAPPARDQAAGVHVERNAPFSFELDELDLPASGSPHHVRVWADVGASEPLAATLQLRSPAAGRDAVVALGAHPQPSRSWPDALMAGYLGAVEQVPVLLTAPDGLPAPTEAALDQVVAARVVGGPVAIDDSQLDDIEQLTASATSRLAGGDRYATGLAVAEAALDAGADVGSVWAATGRNWPDALAAGPAAAASGQLLLLVDGASSGPYEVDRWLGDRADQIGTATVIGGPAAVSGTAADVLALWIS